MPPTSDVIPYAAVLIASLGCFRFWEFWSLGGLEDFYNLLRNSETPNLPVAKAISVILVYIPAIARWLKSSSRITSSQVRGWLGSLSSIDLERQNVPSCGPLIGTT